MEESSDNSGKKADKPVSGAHDAFVGLAEKLFHHHALNGSRDGKDWKEELAQAVKSAAPIKPSR